PAPGRVAAVHPAPGAGPGVGLSSLVVPVDRVVPVCPAVRGTPVGQVARCPAVRPAVRAVRVVGPGLPGIRGAGIPATAGAWGASRSVAGQEGPASVAVTSNAVAAGAP